MPRRRRFLLRRRAAECRVTGDGVSLRRFAFCGFFRFRCMSNVFLRRCFVCDSFICRGFAFCCGLAFRCFMGRRGIRDCLMRCRLLSGCLTLSSLALRCCMRRRFRRYLGHRRYVVRIFLIGYGPLTRVDVLMRCCAISRQTGFGPTERVHPRRDSCIRRSHSIFASTKSEPGQQSHQSRPDRRGEAEVHRGQVEIASGSRRVRHPAIARHAGAGGHPCGRTRLTTWRRHTTGLRGLRGLAANTVLLQFQQHAAFQREQLLQAGNLGRGLRRRRTSRRCRRQRLRCTRHRRTSRRLDGPGPDLRTACLRRRQRGSGRRRRAGRRRSGTLGNRSRRTAGQRRACSSSRSRTRLKRRTRGRSHGRSRCNVRRSTCAICLSRSRLRHSAGRRSRHGRRRARSRRSTRRHHRARSPHRCTRRIQRRNRQHRPQPQTARIVRHKRVRVRIEQGLRGTRQRRAVV